MARLAEAARNRQAEAANTDDDDHVFHTWAPPLVRDFASGARPAPRPNRRRKTTIERTAGRFADTILFIPVSGPENASHQAGLSRAKSRLSVPASGTGNIPSPKGQLT